MQQKAIIFDLDGTLIDSLNDIAICCNEVLESLNYPTHTIQAYKKFVGDGALTLLSNAMPKNSSDLEINVALESFKKLYDSNIYDNTKPYPYIEELLETLSKEDLHLGILSNKPHKFTLQYVEKLFKKEIFTQVHGQKEHIPKKPDPIGAINISNSFNLHPKDIYFIGDTGTDMKTAKNAGMIAVGVLWGFRDEAELLSCGADHIITHPNELLNIIR